MSRRKQIFFLETKPVQVHIPPGGKRVSGDYQHLQTTCPFSRVSPTVSPPSWLPGSSRSRTARFPGASHPPSPQHTYISVELRERLHHVEAVHVHDSCVNGELRPEQVVKETAPTTSPEQRPQLPDIPPGPGRAALPPLPRCARVSPLRPSLLTGTAPSAPGLPVPTAGPGPAGSRRALGSPRLPLPTAGPGRALPAPRLSPQPGLALLAPDPAFTLPTAGPGSPRGSAPPAPLRRYRRPSAA